MVIEKKKFLKILSRSRSRTVFNIQVVAHLVFQQDRPHSFMVNVTYCDLEV